MHSDDHSHRCSERERQSTNCTHVLHFVITENTAVGGSLYTRLRAWNATGISATVSSQRRICLLLDGPLCATQLQPTQAAQPPTRSSRFEPSWEKLSSSWRPFRNHCCQSYLGLAEHFCAAPSCQTHLFKLLLAHALHQRHTLPLLHSGVCDCATQNCGPASRLLSGSALPSPFTSCLSFFAQPSNCAQF